MQIDLDNDEVRVYLTSSQAVFQRDDGMDGQLLLEERRNHRTQLVLQTGNDAGPRPYYYKTFSTVGGNIPGQQSPIADDSGTNMYQVRCRSRPLPLESSPPAGRGTRPQATACSARVPTAPAAVLSTARWHAALQSVCPVCLHPAYCTLNATDIIPGSAVGDFGAPDIQPLMQPGQGHPLVLLPAAGLRLTASSFVVCLRAAGCYQVNVTFAPSLDECATDPTVPVSETNPLAGVCAKAVDGFTPYLVRFLSASLPLCSSERGALRLRPFVPAQHAGAIAGPGTGRAGWGTHCRPGLGLRKPGPCGGHAGRVVGLPDRRGREPGALIHRARPGRSSPC